ncbi:shootin-1-like isoform X2 [Falco cherrug]|uniref:shootin-1-like isoform X2 n=1 Tax=Falco cherrug TaxID=345164 RepID=UPI00247ADD44|nr:shootin-1-like isoform X2 [Falco cherrug]
MLVQLPLARTEAGGAALLAQPQLHSWPGGPGMGVPAWGPGKGSQGLFWAAHMSRGCLAGSVRSQQWWLDYKWGGFRFQSAFPTRLALLREGWEEGAGFLPCCRDVPQPLCELSWGQPAILESGSSEKEDEDEDEEAATVQHPSLGQEVGEAEEQLAKLEQASQALLVELSALETEFEIERTCRQRAEAYAAQVKQENKQLKRLSLAPIAPAVPPEELRPEEDPDPAQHYEQQLQDLQEKISWLLAQQKDLTIQLQDLQRQNQDLQDQLEMGQEEQQRLRAALGNSQRALKSFKRVSQIVTQDYCEVVQQLELEQDLRLHAEAFAHEMLVQKKEANRQSTILLQSAEPSTQLLVALQEVARLTRALEEGRQEQQQRVKELEEQLSRRPEPEELDVAQAALATAEDEKLQLRLRLQEAERRLLSLEEEVALLQEKLAQDPPLQSQTPEPVARVPPPPPPLPPPAPAVPVDPLAAIRQRKGLANLQRTKPEADDAKARAVQEMMERIKNGVVLRPAKDRLPLGQGSAMVPGKQRSAALELQGILGAMRRASRRSSQRQSSLKGRDKQLESILQRRRWAVDASTPASPPPSAAPGTGSLQQDPEDAGAVGRPDPGKLSSSRPELAAGRTSWVCTKPLREARAAGGGCSAISIVPERGFRGGSHVMGSWWLLKRPFCRRRGAPLPSDDATGTWRVLGQVCAAHHLCGPL